MLTFLSWTQKTIVTRRKDSKGPYIRLCNQDLVQPSSFGPWQHYWWRAKHLLTCHKHPGRTRRHFWRFLKHCPTRLLHILFFQALLLTSVHRYRKKTPIYTVTAKYSAKKDASASVNVTTGKPKISISPGAFLIIIISASMAKRQELA